MIRFLLFGFVFSAAMAGMNYYVYKRFLTQLHFGKRARWRLLVQTLFGVELFFVFQTLTHWLPDSPLMYYSLSASVGVTFMLFFVALFYDLMRMAGTRIPYDQERRRFIKIGFDVTMVVAAASYLLEGLFGGLRRPELNHQLVSLGERNETPFRIVQLSDVHVGLGIKQGFVQECVDRINMLEPDIVVITGDLVDRNIEYIKDDLAPLAKLTPVHGTYFVTGNHEYFHDAPVIVEHVRSLGISVLENCSEVIAGRFNLVGINDLISRQIGVMPYDIEAAFSGCDPALKTIVLAHQPKTATKAKDRPFDLMISGHTHGGQIFPFGLLVMIDQPYLAGLYRIDRKKQIFVSRGTGYWGPPLRVLAPSEISVLDIVSFNPAASRA